MTSLACSGLASVQPGRGRIEGDAKTPVAGGGDRGVTAERLGEFFGESVGAAVAAEERDDHRAVLGQGKDGRLVALVGEERSEDADEDAGGADADDGMAGGEESADMGGDVGEGDKINPPPLWGRVAFRFAKRRVGGALAPCIPPPIRPLRGWPLAR